MVIDVSARMFPLNTEFVPSVAELPTCQKTLQYEPPLMILTWLDEPVISDAEFDRLLGQFDRLVMLVLEKGDTAQQHEGPRETESRDFACGERHRQRLGFLGLSAARLC